MVYSNIASLLTHLVRAFCCRRRLRQAGLRGLQAVVRKTISDDLQVNIWDAVHMDKIVPSLLFNMQEQRLVCEIYVHQEFVSLVVHQELVTIFVIRTYYFFLHQCCL